MMRRTLIALVTAVLLVGAAGCSSSSDDAKTTTTSGGTTTSLTTGMTDEEIIADINERIRPSLEDAFDAKTVDCILEILEDGGVGKLKADDVVPAYEDRCGVTATEVTGVITGAALVDRGATEEQGKCVADAVAELSYDEVAGYGEKEINAVYEDCGVDVEALTDGTATTTTGG